MGNNFLSKFYAVGKLGTVPTSAVFRIRARLWCTVHTYVQNVVSVYLGSRTCPVYLLLGDRISCHIIRPFSVVFHIQYPTGYAEPDIRLSKVRDPIAGLSLIYVQLPVVVNNK